MSTRTCKIGWTAGLFFSRSWWRDIMRAVLVAVATACLVFSCAPRGAYYTATYLDTETFDYNVMRFRSRTGESYIVLSEKDSSGADTACLGELREVQIDQTYWLTIAELRTPPDLAVMYRFTLDAYYLCFEKYDSCSAMEARGEYERMLFWERGKIRTRVFSSDDLRGTSVRVSR